MATTGDNSDKLLHSYAERLAGLRGQLKEIGDEIREESNAAKKAGIDPRALNKVVREMMMPEDKRSAQLELDLTVDDYRVRLGLLAKQARAA